MKSLYLIRHGISQHNVLFHNLGKKVFYDSRFYDTKLTPEGHEQSILLGKTWENIHEIDLVLCSSLTRTLETARNIFSSINVPIIALDIIKEFPQGLHTCNKRSDKKELIQQFPEIDFSEVVTEEDNLWNDRREETIDELDHRITSFNSFIKSRKEENIAIISHNSFIGQYKDKKIPLMENGDEEILHCYPYKILI